MPTEPDPEFSNPRLAATYDLFEGERDDLDHYERIVDEFAARAVLDVGCGTGELACRLVRRGITVVGVDPAVASLDIARAKPDADDVTWIAGSATELGDLGVGTDRFDIATMTANVSQVFLTDDDWRATLDGIRGALRPGGVLVFESRDPARRAWENWPSVRGTATLPDDVAETACELTDVDPPFVSFRFTTVFASDGAEIVSDSTLRFRSLDELTASLTDAGFAVIDVRDAPDRPGLEFVFLARRPI